MQQRQATRLDDLEPSPVQTQSVCGKMPLREQFLVHSWKVQSHTKHIHSNRNRGNIAAVMLANLGVTKMLDIDVTKYQTSDYQYKVHTAA